VFKSEKDREKEKMSGQRKFFVIGNWKMNVDKARIDNIVKFMSAASLDPNTGQFHTSTSVRVRTEVSR